MSSSFVHGFPAAFSFAPLPPAHSTVAARSVVVLARGEPFIESRANHRVDQDKHFPTLRQRLALRKLGSQAPVENYGSTVPKGKVFRLSSASSTELGKKQAIATYDDGTWVSGFSRVFLKPLSGIRVSHRLDSPSLCPQSGHISASRTSAEVRAIIFGRTACALERKFDDYSYVENRVRTSDVPIHIVHP